MEKNFWNLSIEERCLHKSWKGRLIGYKELKKLLLQQHKKSPVFLKYLGLMKQFVIDSNVVAREKGLSVVLTYVQYASVASRTVNDVMTGLVSKCFSSPRPKTQKLALQIALLYIEIEEQDVVAEKLIEGLENKSPKVVVACIVALRESLHLFGSQVIAVEPLVKVLSKLLENRDITVREKSRILYGEIYFWVGQDIKHQLQSLKASIVTELEEKVFQQEVEEVVITWYLKLQQEQKTPRADLYDVLKFPKNFHEQCEAKEWKERMEALKTLLQLTSNVNLKCGDYSDVVRVLKKFIAKDSNVLCVTLAIKCLTNLVLALRKEFQPYLKECTPAIFEKFKETKKNVVIALRKAIDVLFNISSFDTMLEYIQTALDNKNPQVKAETCAFLTRCFSCYPPQLNKEMLQAYTILLLKILDDSDWRVRENGAEALGTAWKLLGERFMVQFLYEVDDIKVAKIKDFCEKAVISPKSQAESGGAAVKRGISEPAESEFKEQDLTDEDVMDKASEIFSDDIISDLGSTHWKFRLKAVEKFFKVVQQMDKGNIPAQAIIKFLAKKPGFKENNFQILNKQFQILTYIADNGRISHNSVECCLSEVVDKIGNVRNGCFAGAALSSLAEATSLQYVSKEVLNLAFRQRNPKNLSKSIIWVLNAIKQFGLKVHIECIIDYSKKGLSSTNPGVRNSALALLGTMYIYLGKNLRSSFKEEKPSILQRIDAEFEKMSGIKPPLPVRGKSAKPNNSEEYTDSDSFKKENSPQVNLENLMTRIDISGQITQQVLSDLSNKDWQLRSYALQIISAIITDAKFITPILGDLPTALRLRLADNDKNLVVQTLRVCQMIGISLSYQCPKQLRNFAPGILVCLGDNNANVRAAALLCLNTWMDNCPFIYLFEGKVFFDVLKSGNPFLRIQLFSWLSEKLPTVTSLPAAELNICVPILLGCLEDLNTDVRKEASECLLPFMIYVGYESMATAAFILNPASENTVVMQLDKVRQNLMEKPSSKTKQGKNSIPAPSEKSSLQITGNYEDVNVKFHRSTTKEKLALKVSTATSGKGNKKINMSPSLVVNNMKDKRMRDEKNLIVLKWTFIIPREKFYMQLKNQMTAANWSKILISHCFHKGFMFHIKAINLLHESLESGIVASVANLDLILKWFVLTLNTNPSVLIKSLEYLQVLFQSLARINYCLLESEADSFIPYLILKIGDSNDPVRKDVGNILKLISKVYPIKKLFTYIMQGLISKNAQQRGECLELLGAMIEVCGLDVASNVQLLI